jgi:uncharacterized protein (TIGR00251 family)
MTSARLHVHVTPKASRDEIAERRGGELRLKVTAPPEDGKANEAVRKLLAKRLGVAKSSVTVVSGASSRHKVIEIDGVSERDLSSL